MRPPRISLAPAVACLLALPARAADAPSPEGPPLAALRAPLLGEFRAAILRENDPAAAARFLADERAREELRREDSALFARVYARAAELKDIRELTLTDAIAMRRGVLIRPACAFCRDAAAYKAWAARHMPYAPEAPRLIDEALWSWSTLSESHRAWLGERGLSSAWDALPFQERHERMSRWALFESAAIGVARPRSAGEVDAFRRRASAAAAVLGDDALAPARRRLHSLDEALRRLEAQAVSDPEARQEALSRIFDNLGERPRGTTEPVRDAGGSSAGSLELVEDMLEEALLRETDGTFAGRDLREFYRTVPLEIRLVAPKGDSLGWYTHEGDVLFFNRRHVESYLRSRGAALESLRADAALLRDVARTLSGTFVHEAQHHRQDVWARQPGRRRPRHRGKEVEAAQVQALFILQKTRQDASFREFARRESGRSTVLRSNLARARRLEQEGLSSFEFEIALSYDDRLSAEGEAWTEMGQPLRSADAARAELQRRLELPEAERARLDAGPPLAESWPTREAWLEALRVSSGASLQVFLERAEARALAAYEAHLDYRRREQEIARQTERRYRQLMSGRARDGVPAPGRPP